MRQTDGRTDRRTDGHTQAVRQTDRQTELEALLCVEIVVFFLSLLISKSGLQVFQLLIIF